MSKVHLKVSAVLVFMAALTWALQKSERSSCLPQAIKLEQAAMLVSVVNEDQSQFLPTAPITPTIAKEDTREPMAQDRERADRELQADSLSISMSQGLPLPPSPAESERLVR